jgi:hypothetical protein
VRTERRRTLRSSIATIALGALSASTRYRPA